ncbi:hypothetical protein FMU86_11935 [Listeria monocytogenes]|nr:hypothetical protein [Listeria monocytogenes]
MRKMWTEEELEFLRGNYEKQEVKSIAEKLKRSEASIKQKASRIGVRKLKSFSEEEEEYLEYYLYCEEDSTYYAAAKFLGCSVAKIASWRNYRKLDTLIRKWTQREYDILRHYYKTRDVYEISKMLNRTHYSVAKKASDLGLRKLNYPHKWDAEIRRLGESGYTIKEISEQIQLPLHSVRCYVYANKINYKKAGNKDHIWRKLEQESYARYINAKKAKEGEA